LLYIINLFYKGVVVVDISRGKSSRSHSIRFRFALISTPRPIRAQRRGLLTIKYPIYYLYINLIIDLAIPIAILFHLTKRSQKPKPRFVIVDVYRIKRLRTTNPNYLVRKL
jgi:hypothetical protein